MIEIFQHIDSQPDPTDMMGNGSHHQKKSVMVIQGKEIKKIKSYQFLKRILKESPWFY